MSREQSLELDIEQGELFPNRCTCMKFGVYESYAYTVRKERAMETSLRVIESEILSKLKRGLILFREVYVEFDMKPAITPETKPWPSVDARALLETFPSGSLVLTVRYGKHYGRPDIVIINGELYIAEFPRMAHDNHCADADADKSEEIT